MNADAPPPRSTSPPAPAPRLSLADLLRRFTITESPFDKATLNLSSSFRRSSSSSSLNSHQAAPSLEKTQIFYEPTLAQELEAGFLNFLEPYRSEDPSFGAALAMPLHLLAEFSLNGQDLISKARQISHFLGSIGTSVRRMVELYDRSIRPTKPRELLFLQETDNSNRRTTAAMLVRTDVDLRERAGGVERVLALMDFEMASMSPTSVYAELGHSLLELKRGEKLEIYRRHSLKAHAVILKAVQACASGKASFFLFCDNLKWAVSIYDPSATHPRLLISPFHSIVDTIADQQTSPSFFRVLIAAFCRGAGEGDWVRELPSWQRYEAADGDRSRADGEAADEGERKTVLSESELELEDSSVADGAESSGRLTVIYPDGATLYGTPLRSPPQQPPPPSPPPASVSPPAPRPAPIHLSYLLAEGATSLVWSGLQDGRKVVVKVAKRGRGKSEIVRNEVAIASKLQGVENYILLPEGGYETSEGRVFTMMEYGGRAPRKWSELFVEHRSSLFLSLLRLHQTHHLLHNDANPRNAVVLPPPPSPSSSSSSPSPASSISTPSAPPPQHKSRPRWIDLTMAETGHECEGTECWELRQVWEAMELEEEKENGRGEEVKNCARAEGLVWEGWQGREVLV